LQFYILQLYKLHLLDKFQNNVYSLFKFENRSSYTPYKEFERLTMTEGNAFRTISSIPVTEDVEGINAVIKSTKTHCCYCAMQCQMELSEKADGSVEVKPLEHPINKNKLCVLGQNSAKLFNHRERLTTPLVRRKGELVPSTWEEAMERAVAGFKFLKFKYGNDANAVYSGASISTEKAYLLGKFARVALKTPHIDYNGRYCMSAAAAGANKAFGVDRGLNMPLSDIPKHDVIMVFGANTAETLPIMVNYLLEAKNNGTKFIMVDPRQTSTTNLAALHLQINVGEDFALSTAMLKIILDNGWQSKKSIEERTSNFAETAEYVRSTNLDYLLNATGLHIEKVREAVELLRHAKRPLFLTGRGNDQNSRGVASTLAVINLSLALGANYGTLTGQANGQGGREHGMKADQLPGYRLITNKEAREHVAKVWGIEEKELPGPGHSAFELMQAIGRKEIRGLFVLGSNPVISSPDTDQVRKWLGTMDHLVVVDTFLSETSMLADVVLPGSLWAEETGSTTNLEGRVVLREALRRPPEGAKTDTEIVLEIAERLGAAKYFDYGRPPVLYSHDTKNTSSVGAYPPQFGGEGSSRDVVFSHHTSSTGGQTPTEYAANISEAIFNELRHASQGGPADYYGITYARLRNNEELFWPCPDTTHKGTPRMFTERYAHPDGRAKFYVVPYHHPDEVPDKDYPFQLTTGRYLVHYLTGNHTRRTDLLINKKPEPYVEVHPNTAAKLKLYQDEFARITTRRAEALYKVKITKKIKPDVLFIPVHWEGKQAANRLTNPVLDPICKMPEFKVCAARLEPVPQEEIERLGLTQGGKKQFVSGD
jgi:assimilatory nitrate reductase catalytic subunit